MLHVLHAKDTNSDEQGKAGVRKGFLGVVAQTEDAAGRKGAPEGERRTHKSIGFREAPPPEGLAWEPVLVYGRPHSS